MSILIYSVGYDAETEFTVLFFQNDMGDALTVKLPEAEVVRLIRLLEAAIDRQESVI